MQYRIQELTVVVCIWRGKQLKQSRSEGLLGSCARERYPGLHSQTRALVGIETALYFPSSTTTMVPRSGNIWVRIAIWRRCRCSPPEMVMRPEHHRVLMGRCCFFRGKNKMGLYITILVKTSGYDCGKCKAFCFQTDASLIRFSKKKEKNPTNTEALHVWHRVISEPCTSHTRPLNLFFLHKARKKLHFWSEGNDPLSNLVSTVQAGLIFHFLLFNLPICRIGALPDGINALVHPAKATSLITKKTDSESREAK